jgi:hypothetical protein
MRPSRVVDVVRAEAAARPRLDHGYHGQSEPACQGAGPERELPPIEQERKIYASSMPLVGGQDSCSYSCGRHEPAEDQDEALDRCNRDPVRGLAALSLAGARATRRRDSGRLGGCGNLEQPTDSGVRAFFFSERRKNKSHRDSGDSADAGVGHRMHPGRAKHCRSHHRPDEPLRPIGEARQTPADGDRDRHQRRAAMPRSRSPRAFAHPAGRRNCAPPPGRA